MLSPDDRTGNILTTVALFAIVAGVMYAARDTFAALVLALLFAYLLEPMVSRVEKLFPPAPSGRTLAVTIVCAMVVVVAIAFGRALGPEIVRQTRRFHAALPDILARFNDHSLPFQPGGSIASVVDRLIQSVSGVADRLSWLVMVPVIAVLLMLDRTALIEGTVDLFARHQERAGVKRTVEQVDVMLAQYMRAQLLLSGLSSAFYVVTMTVLGFPYPWVIGILGGALDFLPVVGWILAAAVILTTGWLTHANWIVMAALLLVWRVVQGLVNSPRITGDRLQMEPLTVTLALMAGDQIAGALGVILSVPAIAVLRILWLERASRRKAETA